MLWPEPSTGSAPPRESQQSGAAAPFFWLKDTMNDTTNDTERCSCSPDQPCSRCWSLFRDSSLPAEVWLLFRSSGLPFEQWLQSAFSAPAVPANEPMAEYRLMQSMREQPECQGCGCQKDRLILCWDCWVDFRDAGLRMDLWLAQQPVNA